MPKYKKFKGAKPPKRYTGPPKQQNQGVSNEELQVFHILRLELPTTQMIRGDRIVLNGKEIDAYLPEYKLGVEFDGLYWHNASQGKNSNYHLHKTLTAEQQGIRLIHIWSNEWENNRPIVVDILKKAIGKTPKIEADQCSFTKLGDTEARNFMDKCHILGADKEAERHFGLIYNGEIVMAMSLKKDTDWWNITRVTDRRGIKVLGGFKKMISEIKKLTSETIVGIADRRYLEAYYYKEIDCIEIGATNPKKWFTKDYQTVLTENQFSELKKLVESKKKKLNEEEWQTIWDCGERRFRIK